MRNALLLPVALLVSTAAHAADPDLLPVKARLLDSGIEKAAVERLFDQKELAFDPKVPSLFFTISEGKLDYGQFLKGESLARARAYMKTHRRPLGEAWRKFGVPPEIITGILLVETRLGTYTGSRKAAASLASIAALDGTAIRERIWNRVKEKTRYSEDRFHTRAKAKADWAFKELGALLAYSKTNRLAPETLPGSYAGAIGIPQFMPTSVQHYGADGNNDGTVDLATHPDAIFSVARYLSKNGWSRKEGRAHQVKVIRTYNNSTPYSNTVWEVGQALKNG